MFSYSNNYKIFSLLEKVSSKGNKKKCYFSDVTSLIKHDTGC